MNQTCAKVIGKHIGHVVKVATGLKGDCWGKFLCLRISIDITKPLKRVVHISLCEGLKPKTLVLMYERLPTLCHRCGILGHQVKECLTEGVLGENGKVALRFGSWMIASPGGGRQQTTEKLDAVGGAQSQRAPSCSLAFSKQLPHSMGSGERITIENIVLGGSRVSQEVSKGKFIFSNVGVHEGNAVPMNSFPDILDLINE